MTLPKTIEEVEALYAKGVHQRLQEELNRLEEAHQVLKNELEQKILNRIQMGESNLSVKVYERIQGVEPQSFYEQTLLSLQLEASYLTWCFYHKHGQIYCEVTGWCELSERLSEDAITKGAF